MGMVCCVAKVHDSVHDAERDAEVMSPQREISDLENDTRQKDISRRLTDCDLQGNKGKNEASRQVEDDLGGDSMDVTKEVDDVDANRNVEDNDERKNDIQHLDGLKADEITNDIPRKPDDIKSYKVQDTIQQQPEDEKDDQVQDIIPQKLDGEILSSTDDKKDNYSINLLSLPTELLVKIMFYLPMYDRMMMLYVSQRLWNLAEVPLLWRNFTLFRQPCQKHHHMDNIKNLLKVISKHVRTMHFGGITSKVLETVCNSNCKSVTSLFLYESLSPVWLKMTVDTMPYLYFLSLRISFETSRYCYHDDDCDTYYGGIEDTVALLKIIPTKIKLLKLDLSSPTDLESLVAGIQAFAKYKHFPLPSRILIVGRFNIIATDNSAYDHMSGNYGQGHRQRQGFNQLKPNLPANHTGNLFRFWSTSAFNLSSFEICLYDDVPRPMNLFRPVSVRSYKFGPAAIPTLIQLPGYGIVGLKDNIFHFSKYIDYHGMVSHAVTRDHGDCRGSFIEERHITCIPDLHTISYVDISYENVNSNHLQQLAIACPNLQQLHLQGNVNCLKDLQGLQAIVDKCKNLRSLNLARIDVSWVESYLLLWHLLSSLKKLTLLTIDLCMILLYDSDDDNKQKLVTMCKSCHSLLALNVHLGQESCIECNSSNENFLFSHFPSLTYCALWGIKYSSVGHAFTNCHHLKYLHEYTYAYNSRCEEERLLHLSRNTVIYKRYRSRYRY